MRFAVLDGWRGLAALLVALHHISLLTVSHFYSLSFVQHSFLFVDFFFVLSGFVIAHAYVTRLWSLNEASLFVVRRVGRLWPLHIFVLGLLIAFQLAKAVAERLAGMSIGEPAFSEATPAIVSAIWTNVLLIHSLGIHDKLTWNGASWSISTEFYTYLIFAGVTYRG
jgi:peptidoglycan/LPS O-acetylase OafA/YrhL